MTSDQIAGLKTGDEFQARGRSYIVARSSGWTFGADKQGDYWLVPAQSVTPDPISPLGRRYGSERHIKIRPTE